MIIQILWKKLEATKTMIILRYLKKFFDTYSAHSA